MIAAKNLRLYGSDFPLKKIIQVIDLEPKISHVKNDRNFGSNLMSLVPPQYFDL